VEKQRWVLVEGRRHSRRAINDETLSITKITITITYHILQVIVFPQASLCSYPSPTRGALGSTFPNAFFDTSAAESVKAFGYDMWIGEGIETYGTLKVVVN